jgi:Tfp pilus assembly protein PilO
MNKGTIRVSVVLNAILSVFLTSAIWCFFYFGFLREKWKLKQRVVTQLIKHEELLNHLSHPESSDIWKKQLAVHQAASFNFEHAIPNTTDISDFLEAVSAEANLAGMMLVSFEEKPAQVSGLVIEIPVAVTLTGSYENLIQFIEAIENLSRLTTIKNMHLVVSSPSVDHAMLSIKLTLAAYRGQVS